MEHSKDIVGRYVHSTVPYIEGEGEGEGDIDVINTPCNKQDYLLYIAY